MPAQPGQESEDEAAWGCPRHYNILASSEAPKLLDWELRFNGDMTQPPRVSFRRHNVYQRQS